MSIKQLEPALKLSLKLEEDESRHPLLLAIAEQHVELGKLDQAIELALPLKNSRLWDLSAQRDRVLSSIARGFARSGQSTKSRQAAEEISEDLAKVALISELALHNSPTIPKGLSGTSRSIEAQVSKRNFSDGVE